MKTVKKLNLDRWSPCSPGPTLSPRFFGDIRSGLTIESNGDVHAVGWWRGEMADFKVGCWYHASVKARITNIKNPALSVFAAAGKHLLTLKEQRGDTLFLDSVFFHTKASDGCFLELFFRASPKGRVEFAEPCICEIEAPKHRIARVAAIRFEEHQDMTSIADQRQRIIDTLHQAGALKPDVVLLTEFSSIQGVAQYFEDYLPAAEPIPDGPTCGVFSNMARQYAMYVIGGVVEKQGDYVFNTAVLFDRNGGYLGKYRKTHPTYSEVVKGVSCGSDYPIFELDFGKIAVQICYDQWFPEVARHYAEQGAEILFHPVMGGKPLTWRSRAMDNGIYVVSAGWTPPSMIIDSSGKILAETHTAGIACADLDLDYRKVNVYDDPTLIYGMPGIHPAMRMSIDEND